MRRTHGAGAIGVHNLAGRPGKRDRGGAHASGSFLSGQRPGMARSLLVARARRKRTLLARTRRLA